jgi:hypothetical protein
LAASTEGDSASPHRRSTVLRHPRERMLTRSRADELEEGQPVLLALDGPAVRPRASTLFSDQVNACGRCERGPFLVARAATPRSRDFPETRRVSAFQFESAPLPVDRSRIGPMAVYACSQCGGSLGAWLPKGTRFAVCRKADDDARRERELELARPRSCAHCSGEYYPTKLGQLYCSPRCRVRAWRRAQRARDPAGHDHRPPLMRHSSGRL